MTISSVDILSDEELVQEYNREFRNAVLPVTVLFGVEILFGLVGNILTMYVFMFKYRLCNFRYFVLGLALTDFICCVTTIPGEMVSQIFWFAYPVPTICKVKVFFNQFTICAEASFLTVIAVDRYRKICKPFGWQIRKKAAIYTCLGTYILSGLLAIQTPIFWGVHFQETSYKGRNITVTVCETDEKYLGTKFPTAFTIFNGTLVSIALLCMFVLYILIARRLFFGRKTLHRTAIELDDDVGKTPPNDMESCMSSIELTPRQNHNLSPDKTTDNENSTFIGRDANNSKFQREIQLSGRSMLVKARRRTLIGFYLTVIFIITTVMLYAFVVLMARGVLATLHGQQKVVFFFFLRLYFLNHVINPVVYGLLDTQFRKEVCRLKDVFCKSRCSAS